MASVCQLVFDKQTVAHLAKVTNYFNVATFASHMIDEENTSFEIMFPFEVSDNVVQETFSLLVNTKVEHIAGLVSNEVICQQVIRCLDFLGAELHLRILFNVTRSRQWENYHSIKSIYNVWMAVKALFSANDPTYRHVEPMMIEKIGINDIAKVSSLAPAKARSYIRSCIRARKNRQYRDTFVCPFCSKRFHFDTNQSDIARANCCYSALHTAEQCLASMASLTNCCHCHCALDGEGNLICSELFYGEGSRFQIRRKRGVGPYVQLPKLNLPLEHLKTSGPKFIPP